MFNYKKIKIVKIKALFLLFFFTIFSCQSIKEEVIIESEPFYMARPKILLNSNLANIPLTLNWEEVKGAKSYEIQLSDSSDFNSSKQNWTMRQSSFSMDELNSPVSYIRIRSQFTSGTSLWSEILQVSQQENEIHLQWLR